MSYDLEVVTHREPSPDAIHEALRGEPGAAVDGEPGGEAKHAWVLRERRGERVPAFSIDGPFLVEADDLADAVTEAVVAPRWLVQLSLPASRTKADEKLAQRVARQIAEQGEGAVYDPQDDAVVWPKRRRRHRTTRSEERISIIRLYWFFPQSREGRFPGEWLTLTERVLPEALPVRWGDFEPYQHRVDEEGLDGFAEFWSAQAAHPYGGSFSWTATPPCFGGGASFPDPREPGPRVLPGAQRCIQLHREFDGRALRVGEPWLDAVVELFVETAADLGAFYAAAYVERNVIAKGRTLWYEAATEWIHLSRRWWEGLPPHPTWLTWFGDPYRALVKKAIADAAAEERDEGLFLRLGDEPRDLDELRAVFPALPDDLVWKSRSPGAWRSDPRLPPEREEDPAAVIPQID